MTQEWTPPPPLPFLPCSASSLSLSPSPISSGLTSTASSSSSSSKSSSSEEFATTSKAPDSAKRTISTMRINEGMKKLCVRTSCMNGCYWRLFFRRCRGGRYGSPLLREFFRNDGRLLRSRWRHLRALERPLLRPFLAWEFRQRRRLLFSQFHLDLVQAAEFGLLHPTLIFGGGGGNCRGGSSPPPRRRRLRLLGRPSHHL